MRKVTIWIAAITALLFAGGALAGQHSHPKMSGGAS
jgi:hypothetical protein